MALVADPSYRAIVRQFAGDRDSFDSVFAHAWYKLTTRDMGPRQTCMQCWMMSSKRFYGFLLIMNSQRKPWLIACSVLSLLMDSLLIKRILQHFWFKVCVRRVKASSDSPYRSPQGAVC